MRDTRLKSYIALVDSFLHMGHEALTLQAWMRQALSNLWRQSTTNEIVRSGVLMENSYINILV